MGIFMELENLDGLISLTADLSESINLFNQDISTDRLKFSQVICCILHVTPRLGVVGITNAISIRVYQD